MPSGPSHPPDGRSQESPGDPGSPQRDPDRHEVDGAEGPLGPPGEGGAPSDRPPGPTGGYLHRGVVAEVLGRPTAANLRATTTLGQAADRPGQRAPIGRIRRPDGRADGVSAPSAEVVVGVGATTAVRQSLTEPPTAMGTPAGRAAMTVEALCSCGPGDEGPLVASLVHIGAAALPAIEERFPGAVWSGRHSPGRDPAPARMAGPLPAALAALGPVAAPALCRLLEANEPAVRYFAAVVARDVDHPDLVPGLGRLLFDDHDAIAEAASWALERLQRHRAFDPVRASLLSGAASDHTHLRLRLQSLRALALIREPRAVQILVAFLPNAPLEHLSPVTDALRILTAQSFGPAPGKWSSWWRKHRESHRIEWLIDGLMDASPAVRTAAHEELVRALGVDYGYEANGSRGDRKAGQKNFRSYWATIGREQWARLGPIAQRVVAAESAAAKGAPAEGAAQSEDGIPGAAIDPTAPGVESGGDSHGANRIAVGESATEGPPAEIGDAPPSPADLVAEDAPTGVDAAVRRRRSSLPPSMGADERRAAPRIAINAEITLTSESTFYVGFAEDISEGGIFIATYDVLPVGTPIVLNVVLPHTNLLSLPAVVRWLRSPSTEIDGPPPGIGVQFTNLTPEHQQAVRRFLRNRAPLFYDD